MFPGGETYHTLYPDVGPVDDPPTQGNAPLTLQLLPIELSVPEFIRHVGGFPVYHIELLATLDDMKIFSHSELTNLMQPHYEHINSLERNVQTFNKFLSSHDRKLGQIIENADTGVYHFERSQGFHHFQRIRAISHRLRDYKLDNPSLTVRQLCWLDFLHKEQGWCSKEDWVKEMSTYLNTVSQTVARLNECLIGTKAFVQYGSADARGEVHVVQATRPSNHHLYRLIKLQ